MDAAQTILVAEEDAAARAFLVDNLAADGYHVLAAGDLDDTLRQLEHTRPDAVVADLNGGGLTLVDKVRAADGLGGRLDPDTPLILLSAQAGDIDRLRAYERGCDLYLAKPYSYPELLARLRRLLARTRRSAPGTLTIGALTVNPTARQARLGGRVLALSRYEFDLLHKLASEPERVFTKQQLLRDVWGIQAQIRTRTLDSHAVRLRQKLAGGGQRFVVNVWGVGYRLVDPAPRSQELAA